jgi:hypothetical protein
MTKPEMYRRMLTCKMKDFQEGCSMIRQGYGARGVANNSPLTFKQANACAEWVGRYGGVVADDPATFLPAPKATGSRTVQLDDGSRVCVSPYELQALVIVT